MLPHEPMSLRVLMCGRGLSNFSRGVRYNGYLANYSYNELLVDLHRL